jgi:hypothetical protein
LFLTAALASSVEEDHVKARVWRPSHPDFVFPETVDPGLAHLQNRDDFGIGFAGGGFRGQALAHGAFRALHKAGITDRARYLTVSSGSVWFGIPLYYQHRDDLQTFLGETVPPEELTQEVATGQRAAGTYVTRLTFPVSKFPKEKKSAAGKKKSSSLLSSITDTISELEQSSELELAWNAMSGVAANMSTCSESVSMCDCIVDSIIPDLHEMWTLATIGSMMYQWGIAHPNAAYCHSSQLERVKEQLGNTKVIASQDVKHNLLFLISQSAVIAPQSGHHPEGENRLVTYPFENTLLYTGLPNSYSADELAELPQEKFKALGDVLVEPHGWPSRALEPVSDNATSEVAVSRDLAPINVGGLGEWAGPAACYAADWQIRPFMIDAVNRDFTKCMIPLGEKIVPGASTWSPLEVDQQGVPVTHDLPVADAGVYDDIGHIPLLRRGVKKMVLYDSSAVRDNITGTGLHPNLEEMVYVKASFGQPGEALPGLPPNPAGSPNYAMAENYMTVFEPSEFADLWEKTQAALAAGEPAVIRGKYTVVDNPHFGIKGGWQAEIVWVFTLPSNSFRDALPQETREYIHDYFPNYVSGEPMSHLELSVMAQYNSHLTEQRVVQEVLAMLDGESEQEVVV